MKVAILGKTGSRKEAPFDDPSWTIWGVGTAYGRISLVTGETVPVGRWDAWFEVHALNPRTSRQHWAWLSRHDKPVYTLGTAWFPSAVELPHRLLIERFGAYFMRNSVCWAMAYALHLGAKEIGLWGVDQRSPQEYVQEGHGVQHFIHLARALGVPVRLPDGCALLAAPAPYPLSS